MTSDSDSGGKTVDVDPRLYAGLYLAFGAMWGATLYLDQTPSAFGDLSAFDYLLFLAAASAFVVGLLGVAAPEKYTVDEPSRLQFGLMVVAVAVVSLSLFFQLFG